MEKQPFSLISAEHLIYSASVFLLRGINKTKVQPAYMFTAPAQFLILIKSPGRNSTLPETIKLSFFNTTKNKDVYLFFK